jgi:hypothetical protein
MATWWLAKSGKLLMLLAGLVVLLDLVGRERLQGIQERAELRHDLSKELRRLYEHYAVIDELAEAIRGAVILSDPVFSSTGGTPGALIRGYELSKSPPAAIPPLFSLTDVKEFVTRTTAAMRREFPGSAQREDEISCEAARFIELEARREVARRLGLSEKARSALEAKDTRYRRDEYFIFSSLVFSAFLGIWITIWLVAVHVIPILLAFILLGIASMFACMTQEDRVRIRIDSLVNVALARRLSSFGLTLLGRRGDGEPVKWLALSLFIAGSLLDLIFG